MGTYVKITWQIKEIRMSEFDVAVEEVVEVEEEVEAASDGGDDEDSEE